MSEALNNENGKYMPCTLKIKSNYSKFSHSEREVADYIIQNTAGVLTKPIATVAKEVGVSEASIMRFCKQLGYSGYSELKMMLAKESGERETSTDVSFYDICLTKDDRLEDIPSKIIGRTIQALEDTLKLFNHQELQKAIKAIINAGRIDIYGVANSAIVADDLMNKLLRIGIRSNVHSDSHLQVMSAASLQIGDVAVGISHSGMTKDTVNALREAKKAGALTICITNFDTSVISEIADIKLTTACYETDFNSETTVSRILQLAVIDMLFCGIVLQDYSKYTEVISKNNLLLSDMAYK